MTTHILVTNDDGIQAPSLWALVDALKAVKGVRVTVVVPDRQRSAISNAITLYAPVYLKKIRKDVYTVDGTPTDAVFIGLKAVLKKKPDFIFSGINPSRNLAEDVHYSGTVGAAIEGAVLGVPSVAFSQAESEKDFTTTTRFAQKLLAILKKNKLPSSVVLNVNVPPGMKTLDCQITRLGRRDYRGLCVKMRDERGKTCYRISGHRFQFFHLHGSDVEANKKNRISITPILIDMTATSFMKRIQKWKGL